MITAENLKLDLAQFTGAYKFYRHSLVSKFIYTDGIHYMAKEARAFWLIDWVANALSYSKALVGEEFLVLRLKRTGDDVTLTLDDGNDNVLHKQENIWSDFILDEFKAYVCLNHEGGYTMMLPGEY